MPRSLGREIGLLRKLVTHLEQRLLPFEEVTQTFLRREGLGHVREKGTALSPFACRGITRSPNLPTAS